METPVIAIEKSSNRKVGPVSVTYKSQSTCPKTCPLYNNGCYAETGLAGIHTKRLNKSVIPYSIDLELKAISTLSGTKPLRLDIVGDTVSNDDAKKLSYATKHFPYVWKYTHNWLNLKRKNFGKISVLASIEKESDMGIAHKRGYPFAIVVDKFKSDKKYDVGNGFSIIPCPAQTKDNVTCSTCKLCWKGEWLHKNKLGIAFEAHGNRKKKVSELVNIANA